MRITRSSVSSGPVALNLVRLQKRSGRLNVNTLPSPSPGANHSPSPKPRPICSPSLRKFNCERA